MPTDSLKDFFYSQSALGTYQACQLKFKRRYLEGLFWPTTWSLDERAKELMEQGRQFHLLAQRYYAADGQTGHNLADPLSAWLVNLSAFRPIEDGSVFLPEQELRLHTPDLRLVAKYDLLVFKPDGRAIIYDWKTTGKPPRKEYWERHLQTIVYRYLLCAAGEACSPFGKVSPNMVSMLYWNPQYPEGFAAVPYSDSQFERDGQYLTSLLNEIESREWERFLATADEKRCKYCEYSPICLGVRAEEVELDEDAAVDMDLDWDNTAEFDWEGL
ncbi:MAG TPA: PD-(D/E)XK nuclease family protein [Verrucomicrobiae bacterium]|nr:PD-(D/E)XK nuclease family protein [Verrucomicrobiae bacterium]